MRVHLGGHLTWYDPQKRAWFERAQQQPISLLDLLRDLGIPPAEVAIATVNHRAVDPTTAVATPADTVEFYSAIGGG